MSGDEEEEPNLPNFKLSARHYYRFMELVDILRARCLGKDTRKTWGNNSTSRGGRPQGRQRERARVECWTLIFIIC